MPRQSMQDLLREVDEAAETAPPPALPTAPERAAASPPPAAAVQPQQTPARRGGQQGRRPQPRAQPPEVTESQTPKWMTLERKELRLRGDQVDELTRLRRTLNRRRNGDGERITDNTLIRVAVDLLLSRSGKLRGITEDELRKSVTP
jgi:hypothetical protein